MGFFDFLNKKPEDLPPGKKSHYLGDISKTTVIAKLYAVPKEQRTEAWKKEFLDNVPDAAFRCGTPPVIKGPDGFPYFILLLPDQYQTFQAYTIRHMKDDFLLSSGYGIVMNPAGNKAEWVFSYGDIVNFHISGEFYSAPEAVTRVKESLLEEGEKVLISKPSEKYLPKQAREVIRDFLKSMGVGKPGIFLMDRKVNDQLVRQIVFNIYPEDFPTPKHFDFTIEHLTWYLPRHYIIGSLSKNNEFEKSFEDL